MVYINKYFEKNGSDNISYYYLGNKLIAKKQGATLTYIHQDHLTGTSVVTSDNGTLIGTIKYTPFGTAQFFFDVNDRQATASDAYIYFLTSLAAGGAQGQLRGNWSELARQGIGGLIGTGTGALRRLAINTNSINTNARNAYPLTSPVDLNGGFKFWGYDSNGTPIYALRDPSTYSDSEWNGE